MPDRDEKGDEMTDRMSRRFGGGSKTDESSKESNQDKESKQSQSSKSTMNTQTAQTSEESKSDNIRDRKSVLMYLPEELHEDLDIRFDELNLKHKREHGEALQKNRDYYPAIVEAALSDESVEEILLED